MRYTIEVIREEKKLPIARVVELFDDHWQADTVADLLDDHGSLIQDMQEWCQDNDCGYRSSYNEFKFRTEEQLLMFVLRWAPAS